MEAVMVADSTLDYRREDAARRLGVDMEQVEQRVIELDTLRKAGILLDLDFHGSGLFSVRTPFASLGIAHDDVRRKRIKPGSTELFPDISGPLKSLESRFRQNFAKYATEVGGVFGHFKWIPWTAFDEWHTAHAELEADLDALKEEAYQRYDEFVEEAQAYYADAGAKAWEEVLLGHSGDDEVMIVVDDNRAFSSKTGREAFINYLTVRGIDRLIPRDEIHGRIYVAYRPAVVYSPAEIAEEDARLASARAQQETAQQEEREARMRQQKLEIEQMDTEREHELKVAAFQRQVNEDALRQLERMGSPLQAILDQIEANLYESVQNIAETLRKHDGFRGRSAEKGKELVAWFRQVNGGIVGSDDLDSQLQRLADQIEEHQGIARGDDLAKDLSVSTIQDTLGQISQMCVEGAQRFGESNSGRSRASKIRL